MKTAYYIPGIRVTAKLDQLLAGDKTTHKKASKIAKQLGATDVYWSSGDIAGFSFPVPPGDKFVRLKHTSDGWKLRRCKANKELIAECEALHISTGNDIGEAVGLKRTFGVDGGKFVLLGQAGLEVIGKQYVIEVYQTDSKPKGCKRISDTYREKLVAAVKRKPRKTTK